MTGTRCSSCIKFGQQLAPGELESLRQGDEAARYRPPTRKQPGSPWQSPFGRRQIPAQVCGREHRANFVLRLQGLMGGRRIAQAPRSCTAGRPRPASSSGGLDINLSEHPEAVVVRRVADAGFSLFGRTVDGLGILVRFGCFREADSNWLVEKKTGPGPLGRLPRINSTKEVSPA